MLSLIQRAVTDVFGSDTTKSEDEQTRQSDEETGKLLHTCPDCGEVYLSEQPKQCSACDERTIPVTSDRQTSDQQVPAE